MTIDVNWLAIVLAGLSTMVVGSVWYAKPVFGNLWIKLAGLDEKKMPSPAKAMSLSLLASLVTAFVLAHAAFLTNAYFANSFLQDSLVTALWLWLGFTAARMLTHDLFENRPSKLTALSVGYELVTLLVMGLIIGLLPPAMNAIS